MPNGLVTASYIGATVLFILALGGLSHQETARRGNLYGMLGMGIALVATILGVVTDNYDILIGALLVGGTRRPRAGATSTGCSAWGSRSSRRSSASSPTTTAF